MVISKGVSSLWKKWFCATDAELDTCLARPTNEDFGMYLNERSVLFKGIKILYNLILLQRLILALNPCNNLLLRQEMWLGETILRNLLI